MAKAIEDVVTLTMKDGKPYIVQGDKEYALQLPQTYSKDALAIMGSVIAEANKTNMTMFGAKFDEGKRIAGEFVLNTDLSALHSIGADGRACANGTIRDGMNAYSIAFLPKDMEQIQKTLSEMPDHEVGLLGARGSVLVMGELRTFGTWPLRRKHLVPDHWIVLGNKNDLKEMAKDYAVGAYKTGKMAFRIIRYAQGSPR